MNYKVSAENQVIESGVLNKNALIRKQQKLDYSKFKGIETKSYFTICIELDMEFKGSKKFCRKANVIK